MTKLQANLIGQFLSRQRSTLLHHNPLLAVAVSRKSPNLAKAIQVRFKDLSLPRLHRTISQSRIAPHPAKTGCVVTSY